MENTEPDAVDLFNEQHTTAESIAIAQKLPMASQCPKCEKVFRNDTALRMHDIRKHQNRGWNTSGNFTKKGDNKRKKLPSWSPARLAKFRRTWRKRKEAALLPPKPPKPTVANNPGVVTYCPRCGCNIKVVAAAIAFGDNHS